MVGFYGDIARQCRDLPAFKGMNIRQWNACSSTMSAWWCSALAGYDDWTLRRYREALTSGPLLVDDGRSFSYDDPGSFFTHRHPRTMFGVDRKGWIYMVVVDGRFPGQADGATIAEMVFLAECFGLVEAINLDGGGSSALWTAVDGVISYPRDNGVFDHAGEREVPNIILVR